jgi:hypothetical protein
MTSAIISATIDADYPVAGQDNDSQGFRDNFSIIKDGLATAGAEITDLQTNTAKLNANNNFGGYLIDNAVTNRLYGTVYTTTDAGSINVTLANGSYQEITVTGTATLIVGGWPSEDSHASMKLALKSSTATAYNVTLSADGGSNKVFNSLPITGIVSVDNTIQIIDVWTIDQGATVYFKLDASPTVSNLNSLTDVTITSPTNGQVLKYNGAGWVNGIDSTTVASIDDIVDVVITTPTNGQVLKYDTATSKWVNAADALGDSLTLDNLTDVIVGTPTDGQVLKYDTATSKWINGTDALVKLSDVVITGTPTNGQVLKYNTATSKWINGTDALGDSLTLDNLTDVVITGTPANGQVLKYDTATSKWINGTDNLNTITYVTKIVDNGSGTQDIFEFNGTKLKTSAGVTLYVGFAVGNTYRFDLSHSSNAPGPLRFSTTADTAVPASITPYTTNVTIIGTAGTAGAYIEILITDSTPSSLFVYSDETGIDTSLIGGAVAIPKLTNQQFTGSEDLANAGAADLRKSVSYFSTAAAETATLAAGTDGQIKTFAMVADTGDMVITVTNPAWGGAGTITFSAVGQACTLQYINNKWFCIGNNGAAFA